MVFIRFYFSKSFCNLTYNFSTDSLEFFQELHTGFQEYSQCLFQRSIQSYFKIFFKTIFIFGFCDNSLDIPPCIFLGNLPYMFQNSIKNSFIFGKISLKIFNETLLMISPQFVSGSSLKKKTVNIILIYFQKFLQAYLSFQN